MTAHLKLFTAQLKWLSVGRCRISLQGALSLSLSLTVCHFTPEFIRQTHGGVLTIKSKVNTREKLIKNFQIISPGIFSFFPSDLFLQVLSRFLMFALSLSLSRACELMLGKEVIAGEVKKKRWKIHFITPTKNENLLTYETRLLVYS